MTSAISIENVSKSYRLGLIGRGTLAEDLNRWWAKVRGLPDPFLKIGEKDHGNRDGETVWALKDVSFQIRQGETVGIIGRNGAGKSTLLKILSRVTAPTSGEVKINGRIASLLEVGTGFHPELTGRENIFLNGAIFGMSRKEIQRKFDEIVDFSGVEKFIDTPVKRYSSGMYVRLGFAVAAHLEPDILIVDEVLAVGDAQFQKKCLGKMGNVAKDGRTVLFVSHNMTAIKSLCQKTAWLDSGVIVKAGETDRIVQGYLQTGANSLMKWTWEDPSTAPGNNQVRLHHISISPLDDEKKDSPITVKTPLQLKAAFWNYIPDSVMNFSIVIYNIEGLPIFNTGSLPCAMPQGLVWGSFVIPADFLNDNTYTVRLLLVRDTTTPLLDEKNVLTFEVHEDERMGQWYGKMIGVIRPKFDWTLSVNQSDQ